MKKTGRVLCSTGFLVLLMALLLAFPAQAAKTKASIRLNVSKVSLNVGGTKRLKATVKGKSRKVVWKSSNRTVATVSNTGKVTAKKAGKAVITARANGKTARCTVTVKKASYKTLYQAFLAKSTVKAGNSTITPAYFRMLNIDKKGVPELIVTERDVFSIGTYHVYTIRNGAVKYMGSCSMKGMSTPPVIKYSSKYKGIYVSGWTNGVGGAWSALHGISGTKLVRKQHAEEYHSFGDSYYIGTTDRQQLTVTRSRCASFVKKYFGNLKTYSMVSNTAENRERYF